MVGQHHCRIGARQMARQVQDDQTFQRSRHVLPPTSSRRKSFELVSGIGARHPRSVKHRDRGAGDVLGRSGRRHREHVNSTLARRVGGRAGPPANSRRHRGDVDDRTTLAAVTYRHALCCFATAEQKPDCVDGKHALEVVVRRCSKGGLAINTPPPSISARRAAVIFGSAGPAASRWVLPPSQDAEATRPY